MYNSKDDLSIWAIMASNKVIGTIIALEITQILKPPEYIQIL